MPSGGESAAILIVALARRYGGIDARVVQMAKALHGRRPYWVAVMAGSPLHAELTAQGLNALPLAGNPRSLRNLPALMRIMREKGVALVDAQNPQSYLLGIVAAVLTGVPGRVCTIHLDFRRLDGGWLRLASLRALTTLCGRLGSHFIAVSREIAGYLADAGVPDARITVGINAVAPLPPSDGGNPRAEFGWSSEDFVLAVPARLDVQKGHVHLLAALERLGGERAGLKCLIIGEGPLRASLEAEAVRRGLRDVVHFAGFRRDVPALVRAADLVCLPSLFEGLPFAAIEAAQCGVPILASAVGGLAEHLTHGVTARLVPPADVDALVREIRWCRANRGSLPALGDAARVLVESRFSPERMLAEFQGAYARALEGTPPSVAPAAAREPEDGAPAFPPR